MTDQNLQPSEPGTEIATLTPVARALLVLKSEQTEKNLRELIAKSKDITEVKNADGREQVHRMAMDLRKARTTITNTGKTAREDATAFSKAVIDEEKRLLLITADEEERVFKLRDDYDAKVKAEAAERERKEKERKDAITAKIDEIAQLPVAAALDSAAELAATIADLETFEPSDEDFAEFAPVAKNAANVALAGLRALHSAASAREQMAAQLKEQEEALAEGRRQLEAQQAELKRQQDELAEKQRITATAAEVVQRTATLAADLIDTATQEQAPLTGLDDGVPLAEQREEEPLPEVTRTTHTVPGGYVRPYSQERQDAYTADDNQTAHGGTPLACDEQVIPVNEAAGFSEAGLSRVLDAVNAAPTPDEVAAAAMTMLRFEGYSDDTFGEYLLTGDDYDNAGSGRPIRWLVTHPDHEGGIVVVGQYGAKGVPGFWMIGVAAYDPENIDIPLPQWPMHYTRGEFAYTPALIIEAPAGVVVQCLEREEIEA
ncbi:hypothetical protein [Cupriavidus metallidurans]